MEATPPAQELSLYSASQGGLHSLVDFRDLTLGPIQRFPALMRTLLQDAGAVPQVVFQWLDAEKPAQATKFGFRVSNQPLVMQVMDGRRAKSLFDLVHRGATARNNSVSRGTSAHRHFLPPSRESSDTSS